MTDDLKARMFAHAVALVISLHNKDNDGIVEANNELRHVAKLSKADRDQLIDDVRAVTDISGRWGVTLAVATPDDWMTFTGNNPDDGVAAHAGKPDEPDFPTIHDDDVIQGAIKTLRYAYELGPEDTLGQMTYDLIEWACDGVGRTIRDDASLADALMSVAKTLDRCSPSQGRGPERTTTTTDLRERLVYWAEDIDKVLDGDNVTVGSLGELVHQALEMRAEVIGCDLKANIDAFAQYTLAAALR